MPRGLIPRAEERQKEKEHLGKNRHLVFSLGKHQGKCLVKFLCECDRWPQEF